MRSVRPLLLSLFLALSPLPALAEMELGVIGGAHFGDITFEASHEASTRMAFAIGGTAEFRLNDVWGLRVEPMWVSKGAEINKFDSYWGTSSAEFKLDYIEVPVLARLKMAPTPTHGYVLGGVSLAFLTDATADIFYQNSGATLDLNDVVTDFDAAIILGVGAAFPMGSNRAFVDGRISIGITDINDGGTVTIGGTPIAIDDGSVTNVGFQLLGGVHFPVGK